ncbi:GATA zinc finger domain-containing protein [Elsinoe australis]|uniref:GATA zinc finger domain-containing protein n=1 Tax=Elsinoe australis TaxID=40998 RepID=A0A4U7AV94_9PEZI|nr:GATA zinc finger domain-containing protein [Elsinoe australis]
METTGTKRPALPPIQFLESNKVRREEGEYRKSEAPASTVTSSNILNTPYPTGPPPPYSATVQQHNPTPTATPHTHTPDIMSKRQDMKDASAIKHSLPSLHEALGVDRHTTYTSEAPPSATTQSALPTPTAHSPQSPRRYQDGPSPPHRPQSFAPVHPPFSQADSSASRAPVSEAQDYRRSEYAESYRTYQRRSPPPSQGHRASYPGHEPARIYETSPQGPPPPSSQFTYGYAHSSAPFTSGPAPTSNPTPIFHPSTIPQASPETSHSWRSGPPSATAARPSQTYSESVKRHLDIYDFEMALNEIADHSTITLDFSRQYGARLHQTQRSGIAPGTLPAITEIDDLMNKNRQTMEALARLRETLVAHQTAYFQQAQENLRLNQDSKRNDSVHQPDESKAGGFAGAEPKKRRGRNAAPGRCHSCNRAETPEWRRGPDGARTLCNACGLHYAKLTRKAGANKAAIGGSSLRPKGKELDGSDA